jgi:RNA-directed DNA polymerase
MSDIIKTQQGLARKAETNRTHRFEDLYHLLCKREWIEEALQHVLDNDGAGTAGVDGMSWKNFNDVNKSDFENEKFREQFIESLQEELKMLMEPIWEADFFYFSNRKRSQADEAEDEGNDRQKNTQ